MKQEDRESSTRCATAVLSASREGKAPSAKAPGLGPQQAERPQLGAGGRFKITVCSTGDGDCDPDRDFHALLMSTVARLANSRSELLVSELDAAFRGLCGFLEIERAALWCRLEAEAESLVLRYSYGCRDSSQVEDHPCGCQRSDDGLNLQLGADLNAAFPWTSAQAQSGRTIVLSNVDEFPIEAQMDKQGLMLMDVRSGVVIPMEQNGRVIGAAIFGATREERTWPQSVIERFRLVTLVLSNGIARQLQEEDLKLARGRQKSAEEALARCSSEIKQLKDRLEAETEYLKTEIKTSQSHGEIIGRSSAIKRVLHQVEQVAPVDSSVLITGETGTGKELIARAIHRLSKRRDRMMVLVNCAALPATLVESELFGRERGAYTGALTSEVGRFEVADGSTIFLDEIGELSLEVQAKLLRVLQEGEFQRLGSPKVRRVNVRVIAATNRDLARQVREGRFREDLYYRLQVFPIDVPPLRERMEDLPSLVMAFVDEFSARMSKQIKRVPRHLLERLEHHSWPGNIRELRNVIERGVILSAGETLVLPDLTDWTESTTPATSLEEVERMHIIKTLGATGWRVKGPFGAARRLDLNPSTLYSRMAKLGIHREGPNFVALSENRSKPAEGVNA